MSESPDRPPSPRRRLGPWIGIAAFVLFLSIRGFALLWTDYLWYDSVALTGVWRTTLFTRVGLVVVASLIAAGLILLNTVIADRLSPRRRSMAGNPDEELLERFQGWFEPRVWRVRVLIALGFGLLVGVGATQSWDEFLLWRHGGDFGLLDPIFSNDVGLYVFSLPFYRDAFTWMFQLMLVTILVTAALHYLNGAIQLQTPNGVRRSVSGGVKVHLSALLAVLALLKAVGYQLDRWELLYSTRGRVVGASFTDVNAQEPALFLLVLISIVAAVILLVNIRFRGWRLPAVAVGLWLATSILIGGVYPALVQRFQVEPDEVNKEAEFVVNNISFSRLAYGLDAIEIREFGASADLDAAGIAANRPTIDNLRLWDSGVLARTYAQLQDIRTFYGIGDVDIDRYLIDGELTQVMISARELDEPNIPPPGGWVNDRLVYTHGFGAVLSPANAVTQDGQPEFFIGDIPPEARFESLTIDEPRVYFGDLATDEYRIVGTAQPEVDFPIGATGDAVENNFYDGAGGIELGNFFRRAAFALRFVNLDTLISGQLDSDSKVLLIRNIRERATKAAPFLESDADPYLVVLDGRLVWVLDMYTISDRFPYASYANTSILDLAQGLPNRFNYLRNSVKATIDAHDGTMNFFVVDPEDPIIATQQRIFPELFTDGALMPQELREHLRYPGDLFRIQSEKYRLYHVTDPTQFFSNVDPWQFAIDPSNSPRLDLRNPNAFVEGDDNTLFRPMLPYYQLMKLPEEDDLSFLIMQPFTPADRPNMVSFLVAKSGPAQYGEIIDYSLPADRALKGPGQVGDEINQDPEISQQFTLLGQGGSRVIQGTMLVVPVEQSLLYVQPIYISASPDQEDTIQLQSPFFQQTSGVALTGLPEFKKVVVAFEDRIFMRDSLDEALLATFGVDPGSGEPGDGPAIPDNVADLLSDAEASFGRAEDALRDGDLATYQSEIERAAQLITEARRLLAEAETG
ncbi:MAG: UPF0182 family protein [Acidimicrobiia bacterium]|nr:UPF0182 family protein [Acidimicrobiia bacterium]